MRAPRASWKAALKQGQMIRCPGGIGSFGFRDVVMSRTIGILVNDSHGGVPRIPPGHPETVGARCKAGDEFADRGNCADCRDYDFRRERTERVSCAVYLQ